MERSGASDTSTSTRSTSRVTKGFRPRTLAVALLVLPLLVVGALASSTTAIAATTTTTTTTTTPSSGAVVLKSQVSLGSLFWDPSSNLLLSVDQTIQQFCDPTYTGSDSVALNELRVKVNNMLVLETINGTNAPAYLYRTTVPITNLDDRSTVCAPGSVVSAPVATGTVNAIQITIVPTQGTTPRIGNWEETTNGSFVDATTGNTCHLNAFGVNSFSYTPLDFQDTATINTFGC